MNLLCNDGIVVRIDDPSYSPYLNGMRAFGKSRDVVDDLYRVPYPSTLMRIYRSFLNGETPSMDDEVEAMFDYMGHSNRMAYPMDYWAVKLHDNWVRDQMYPMELYNDPYYDLVKIPIVNKFPSFLVPVNQPPGVYIAGGLPAWMAGFTISYNDVDYFFTNENALETMLKADYDVVVPHPHRWDPSRERHLTMDIRGGQNTVSLISESVERFGSLRSEPDAPKHQLVLRLYKAPTEIIHGFDVDVCGVLWDGKDLWATRRAIYAAKNKINWFDPKRASPSYAYRLSKYMTRGIEVGISILDPGMVIEDRILDLWMRIQEAMGIIYPSNNIQAMGQLFYHALEMHHRKLTFKEQDERANKIRALIPRDPASILILSSMYHFHTGLWKIYDYETIKANRESAHLQTDEEIDDYLSKVQWLIQDPMAQVSSTIYPTPLTNLREWWMQSPFINPGMEWPRTPKERKPPSQNEE